MSFFKVIVEKRLEMTLVMGKGNSPLPNMAEDVVVHDQKLDLKPPGHCIKTNFGRIMIK